MNTTEKKKSNIKRDTKYSWTLFVVVAIFILLKVFSKTGIYQNDNIMGIAYLLLAFAFGYTSIIRGKKLQQERREYGHYATIIFVGGIFAAMWVGEALDLFFK